jgi:hypothetical protein
VSLAHQIDTRGQYREVTRRVEGQDLMLIAGEADEDHSGRLVWHRLTRPDDVEAMSWLPARPPLRLVARQRP